MYFHSNMAWPPATYDVISRNHITNHNNWPSLNLSQNVREWWTNSYWKREVLTFYPLGMPSRPQAYNAQSYWKHVVSLKSKKAIVLKPFISIIRVISRQSKKER